jgi:uncharacterized protein YkwD
MCKATTMMVCVLLLLPAGAAAAGGRAATADAEAKMIDVINEVRSKHGLDGLRQSGSLSGSAGRFSHWLMSTDTFGHAERIRAGDEFAFLGEALEMHAGRKFQIRAAVDRWMGSATHRALLLTKLMPWVGPGVTRGLYGSRPSTIWVLQFGKLKPPTGPLPTPPLPLP